MLTEVAGIRVGHWTDAEARTGCTVVLFPAGTTAAAEIRGGAPASRELSLLSPERTVDRIDALVLTGGSAFGLAAADGVVRWCEERGIGFPTAAGPVPIVPALALFDLGVGDGSVRPGPDDGYAASAAAADGAAPLGSVGAGTGATVAKWRGREHSRPGGLGGAVRHHDGLTVAALVAVNAFGDLPGDAAEAPRLPVAADAEEAFASTTLAVVATNATLTKGLCLLVAQSGHDGFARALDPAHTRFDGDAVVAAATGALEASIDVVRVLAARVVEDAIRAALTS